MKKVIEVTKDKRITILKAFYSDLNQWRYIVQPQRKVFGFWFDGSFGQETFYKVNSYPTLKEAEEDALTMRESYLEA